MSEYRSFAQPPDWRLRGSIFFTAAWLVLGFIYISKIVGWTHFASQSAPSLGNFLEGAFAPLAFLWLVVGFFLQQQQLHDNTRTIQLQLEEMRRTAEHSEVQARSIAATELHSRQDTFLRVRQIVSDQLGMIVGWLITSYDQNAEDLHEQWQRTARGEHNAFSLEAVRRCLTGEVEASELFFGSQIRRNHSERFMRAFERLLAAAADCDPNGMIEEALRDGSHGRLYRLMCETNPTGEAS